MPETELVIIADAEIQQLADKGERLYHAMKATAFPGTYQTKPGHEGQLREIMRSQELVDMVLADRVRKKVFAARAAAREVSSTSNQHSPESQQ